MKKLYTEQKWREQSKRRQASALESQQRRNQLLSQRTSPPKGPKRRTRGGGVTVRKYSRIVAPPEFSFVHNAEGVIKFLNEMRERFQRKQNIEIDIGDATLITADAITVLVSRLKDTRYTRGFDYRGNAPADENLRHKFTESGFYNHVISNVKPKNADYGSIRARGTYQADGGIALELIRFITTKLLGRYEKRGGVYNTILECMNNTVHHAAGRKVRRKEKWWVSVHFDEDTQKGYFTFVDNGVGIFNSRDPSVRERAMHALGVRDNAGLLRKMLLREIPSSTGIPYRGQGLPSMRDCLLRGDIQNLIIVTNDVYANVASNDYRPMETSFDGTMLYWEISR